MKPRLITTTLLLDPVDDRSEVTISARFTDADEHDDVGATIDGEEIALTAEQLARAEEDLGIAYHEAIIEERERRQAHLEAAADDEWAARKLGLSRDTEHVPANERDYE